ncbi:alpha/beta hydrolase family protein [Microbispora sp. NBC_01189]|uniref:alpha/beta hydrolase n=1 Tax=Microbispora sp. NBC_01189 TaxID=2903583 RepID=UPI002E1254B5|nr:alpha/beta hydrolase family protein [Microbispora sp. NBC_01189]
MIDSPRPPAPDRIPPSLALPPGGRDIGRVSLAFLRHGPAQSPLTQSPLTQSPLTRSRLGRSRPGPARRRRRLLAALVTASLAVPVIGAARPEAVPAPVPPPLPPLRAANPTALADRYAAVRGAIEAAMRAAAARGHPWRAAILRAMADPARHFLSFDGRDGGRAAEVFGDLAGADRIAVIVPGSGTGLDTYGLLRGGSMRLQRALGGRGAVVAWLGYRTPSTVSLAAATPGRADEAAPALRAFVRDLVGLKPAARVSLPCHSYGGVVCGQAAHGLDVADVILYGSPGAGVDDAAAMGTRAAVWAARGTGDWVGRLPHAAVRLPFGTIGLGADPVDPRFGARIFAAGDGGHSDYLKDGSPALADIARIVSGQASAEAGS